MTSSTRAAFSSLARSSSYLLLSVEILHSELRDSLLEGDVHDLKEVAHLVLGEPLLRLGILGGLGNSLLVLPLSDVGVVMLDLLKSHGSPDDAETEGSPPAEADKGRDLDGRGEHDRVGMRGSRHPANR
ncbi:hypothetical protein PENTCL1PPCAC_708 [Pristionchus entomophagus]|uniref:Uncharacterized protein n=1 Tax=Pristionchus entomophagus TaxID=358040 RepID=A0AAV5S986_9BILA|nr:hypothetical protein PENTCL1PPCAC_708 [Pristionchus entomophagus]